LASGKAYSKESGATLSLFKPVKFPSVESREAFAPPTINNESPATVGYRPPVWRALAAHRVRQGRATSDGSRPTG